MHMADALLSPAVGGVMWVAAAGTLAYSATKLSKGDSEDLNNPKSVSFDKIYDSRYRFKWSYRWRYSFSIIIRSRGRIFDNSFGISNSVSILCGWRSFSAWL